MNAKFTNKKQEMDVGIKKNLIAILKGLKTWLLD